jgi:hypothetical protein
LSNIFFADRLTGKTTVTKKEHQTELLRTFITEATGRPTDNIPDDQLHAVLEFFKTHAAWATICNVFGLTKQFERIGDPDRSPELIKKHHHELQAAIAPGIRAGRGELLTTDELQRPGFYRIKKRS